jgi:hypothetical protein
MRRVYVTVTPEFVGVICKDSLPRIVSIKSALPADAEFISTWWNPERACFHVLYEHESFEDIPEGDKYPEIEAPVINVEELPSVSKDLIGIY